MILIRPRFTSGRQRQKIFLQADSDKQCSVSERLRAHMIGILTHLSLLFQPGCISNGEGGEYRQCFCVIKLQRLMRRVCVADSIRNLFFYVYDFLPESQWNVAWEKHCLLNKMFINKCKYACSMATGQSLKVVGFHCYCKTGTTWTWNSAVTFLKSLMLSNITARKQVEWKIIGDSLWHHWETTGRRWIHWKRFGDWWWVELSHQEEPTFDSWVGLMAYLCGESQNKCFISVVQTGQIASRIEWCVYVWERNQCVHIVFFAFALCSFSRSLQHHFGIKQVKIMDGWTGARHTNDHRCDWQQRKSSTVTSKGYGYRVYAGILKLIPWPF